MGSREVLVLVFAVGVELVGDVLLCVGGGCECEWVDRVGRGCKNVRRGENWQLCQNASISVYVN